MYVCLYFGSGSTIGVQTFFHILKIRETNSLGAIATLYVFHQLYAFFSSVCFIINIDLTANSPTSANIATLKLSAIPMIVVPHRSFRVRTPLCMT